MTSGAIPVIGVTVVLFFCACSQKQDPAPSPPSASSEPAAAPTTAPSAGQIETAVVDFKPVQPELVLVGKVAYGEDRYSKISSPLQGRVVEVRAESRRSRIVERAYERGGATILDLLDAARTSRTIQQNFIEALFSYQRNLFQLESSVGQEITS